MLHYLVFGCAGRLLIWLFQTNGITVSLKQRYTKEDDLLREFLECDLCVGFWVYLFLALFAKTTLELGLWPKLIEKVVIAGLTSLLVHLIRIGWDTKFAIIQY